MIWDKTLAATGQDGALKKLEIPANMSNFLFQLNPGDFPILSSLSLDDYDLFSDAQIDSLILELLNTINIKPTESKLLNLMAQLAVEAKSSGKAVLFDPFRSGS